jgi:hypothetical protein
MLFLAYFTYCLVTKSQMDAKSAEALKHRIVVAYE